MKIFWPDLNKSSSGKTWEFQTENTGMNFHARRSIWNMLLVMRNRALLLS